MSSLDTLLDREPGSRRRRPDPLRLLTPAALGVSAVVVVGLALLALVSAPVAIDALGVCLVAVLLVFLPKSATAYLIAFIAVLFLIPSTLAVTGPLHSIGQPSTILGWGAGVLWIAGRLHPASGLDRQRNPARWVALYFLVLMILAFGVAYTRPLTPLEIQGTYRSIAKLSSYFGVGLLATDALRTRRDIDRVLLTVILGASFSAVIGLIQFRTGFNYIDKVHFPGLDIVSGTNGGSASLRQGLHRVSGTAHHPIEFAVTLCVALAFALHYSVHLPKSRLRTLIRGCAVILAIGVPAGISRTGAVSIIIVVVVLSFDWTWRRRANVAALAIVALTATAVAVPRLLGTVKSLFLNLSGKASIKGRTSDYSNVEPFLHGHLLLGRGQGTFQVQQYFTLDDQYLNVLLTGGLVGLTGVIAVYLSIAILGRGARKRGRDQVDRSLGQALVASGLALTFSAATFDLFGFTQALGLTVVLLGAAGALWRITYAESREADWAVFDAKAEAPTLQPVA